MEGRRSVKRKGDEKIKAKKHNKKKLRVKQRVKEENK